MDRRTGTIILHEVTDDDLSEVARTWPSDHRPISEEEAKGVIAYIHRNAERNIKGSIIHLCLAVCLSDAEDTIIGWCGLDGSRSNTEPEIFILLDEGYRGKGYGTLCAKELLKIAAEHELAGVHGGCAEENIASARVMEKSGMIRYGTEENGDPLFRFSIRSDI